MYHQPEKIRFEVQENELWTVVRRLLTICQQLTVHGSQPIAIKDKVGADDKIHLNANQRKQGLKFKKMSCGLWSVSRGRLSAVINS